MPTLVTERLHLRDFAETDWDQLNALVTDPSVTRYMHFATWDERKRRAWFAVLVHDASTPRREACNWAITLRSDGLLIGWLFIGGSLPAEGSRGCGYALSPRFWGQGYMPEALRAAIDYEFTVLGTQRISAECETENVASARVMQKSGMEYEGTFYEPDFEGDWADRHRYQVTAQPGETR
ncbi:MAG TPA: GNAT family N-acetyltransferase [Ktedonobacterales bacterium]